MSSLTRFGSGLLPQTAFVRPCLFAALGASRFAPQPPVRLLAPATSHRLDVRPYATPAPQKQQHQQREAESLLAQQRLRRPLSPHLTIYKWEITSVLSSLMRITGVALSASLYLFGAFYLASPYLGLDLSSSAIAAAFGNLPAAVRYPVKFMVSWLLTFHSFNALRYLSWDMTIGINNKQIARTGWTVAIASVVAAFGLTVFA